MPDALATSLDVLRAVTSRRRAARVPDRAVKYDQRADRVDGREGPLAVARSRRALETLVEMDNEPIGRCAWIRLRVGPTSCRLLIYVVLDDRVVVVTIQDTRAATAPPVER